MRTGSAALKRSLAAIIVGILAAPVVLLGIVVGTLAFPFVESWRTGDPGRPLPDPAGAEAYLPDPRATEPLRIWIDTDAACGVGSTTDPDDCLAILLLARSAEVEIAGISTVHGNAPLEVTDRTTRRLVSVLHRSGLQAPPVYAGAAGALSKAAETASTPAATALQDALSKGPLTIVALGPLTNIAAVLAARPELAAKIERIVAVMGRRPGHLFHPSEGSGQGSLLGHGPIFRDFNVAQDEVATATVLKSAVPLTLIPYEAAREVLLTEADLNRMAHSGEAGAWVAKRTREWLDYWNEDVGQRGFYPFDLVAAVHVLEPKLTRCAGVRAWVGRDEGVFFGWHPTSLLVSQGSIAHDEALADGDTIYCSGVDPALGRWLMQRLTEGTDSSPKPVH